MAHSLLCTSHLSLLQRSAHAEQHIMQILKVELSSFWPRLSIDLGTCRVMCGEFNIPVLPLSLHHSSSSPTCPSSPLHGVFIFHLVCYFMFVFLLSLLLLLLFLHLSSDSAGGFSQQPRHGPVWAEQGGGHGERPQHQEGSLPRDLQPAGVRAPPGG